ncbi:MAG: imidazole glycerol phosphate synthase subunit HisH [Ferrimicrobium sp.]
MVDVAVIDYGIGNLGSATNAFRGLGVAATSVTHPEEVRGARLVVVPGVGSFGACMTAFREGGFCEVVRELIELDRPVLGICVGMQMLFESSEESPEIPGMGVLSGSVVEMAVPGERLPEMQWNVLGLPREPHQVFRDFDSPPWMYFVHSYAVESSGDAIAMEYYGRPWVAAVARGSLIATQFHPEKSSVAGREFLAGVCRLAEIGVDR